MEKQKENRKRKNYDDSSDDDDPASPVIKLKCFICEKGEEVGKIHLFKDKDIKVLEKCNTCLQARKRHKLDNATVTLPDLTSTNIGYHSKPCYSSFTSLKRHHLSDDFSPS